MKKSILFFVVFLLIGTYLQAQLLWQISGNGLKKPSYIIGTHSNAPIVSLDSIRGLRAAFNSVEQVCGVVAVTDTAEVEQASPSLPAGTTLMSLFTFREQAMLRPFLKKMYAIDIAKAPFSEQEPITMLVSMEVVDYCISAADLFHFMFIQSFSDSLQKIAIDKGLPVIGLESRARHADYVNQQLDLHMPMKKQKKALLDYVTNYSKCYESMIKDIEAYQTLDLDSINQHWYVSGIMKKGYRKILNKEQKEWAEAIPSVIGEHSTLIVLPLSALLEWKEKGSIMQMLRKKGYTVSSL